MSLEYVERNKSNFLQQKILSEANESTLAAVTTFVKTNSSVE